MPEMADISLYVIKRFVQRNYKSVMHTNKTKRNEMVKYDIDYGYKNKEEKMLLKKSKTKREKQSEMKKYSVYQGHVCQGRLFRRSEDMELKYSASGTLSCQQLE